MKHLIFVVKICLAGGITSYGQLVPQAKISSQSKTGSKREKQGSVEASPLVENCDIHLDAITTGDTKLTGYVPQ